MNNNVGYYGNRQKATSPIKAEANEITTGSSEFLAAPQHYQKLVSGLIEDTNINARYLANTAINPSVIERQDFDLLQAVTKANPWFSMEALPEKEVLMQDLHDYQFIMRTLTSEVIIEREDASSIVNSVLAMDSSNAALEATKIVFTEAFNQKNPNVDINAMVSEATAPQVQPENSGPSK